MNRLNLILLGPPGSGKGTQAKIIVSHFDIPHVSTGDMLRSAIEEKSPIGLEAQAKMAKGELVEDSVILQIVKDRLSAPDCESGVLFDGFPRTIPQAEGLVEVGVPIDVVLALDVPDEVVVERISGRRVHEPSGRVYHIRFNPPKKPDIDDVTKEPLIKRPDDAEATVRERLEIYRKQTEPLIEYYRNSSARFLEIDGNQDVDVISKQAVALLQE